MPESQDLFLDTAASPASAAEVRRFLIYDVGPFYDNAGEYCAPVVHGPGISGRRPIGCSSVGRRIESPVQVAPVARVLAAASVKDADFGACDIVRGSTGQDLGRRPLVCLFAGGGPESWRWPTSASAANCRPCRCWRPTACT